MEVLLTLTHRELLPLSILSLALVGDARGCMYPVDASIPAVSFLLSASRVSARAYLGLYSGVPVFPLKGLGEVFNFHH